MRTAIEGLRELGVDVREVSLPRTDAAVVTYYVIATAEASSNLARYDGVKFGTRHESRDLLEMYEDQAGFGAEAAPDHAGDACPQRRLLRCLLRKAQAVRTLIREDFQQAFQDVDLLVTPVTLTLMFKFGEKVQDH
ncbi:MAG: amidase family protein [Nitrospiraceae bacterium]